VKSLIIASNNSHKAAEMIVELKDFFNLGLAKDVAPQITWEESSGTFLGNARIKAQTLKKYTQKCVLADDSGLIVYALDGRPGVDSSSFGGVEGDHARNNERLFHEMRHIPADRRQAAFVCTLVFIDDENRESIFEGRLEGAISECYKGSHGFGYDPLFLVGGNRSLAELTIEEKSKISHRGRALQAFKDFLLRSR
jgi:XTP/dITP diphosphohydrolase